MCLITVKPIGVELPKPEHMINGERSNSDGIGCAYWKTGTTEVVIKKDFKHIEEFVQWLYSSIKPEDSIIIHFRYATSGLKDEGNRHPFPLTKDGELLRKTNLICTSAVAHNGVLTDYSGHAKYSDTQKFIMDILSDEAIKNNLASSAVRRLLSEFIGTDRLAFIMNNGEIYVFGTFIKEGGILFSNLGYKNTFYRLGRQSGYGYETNYDLLEHQYQPNFGNVNNNNAKIGKQTEGMIDTCDNCGKKTFVRYYEDPDLPDTYLFLCKKCRKLARKGKLDIKKEDKDEGRVQCESCHELFPQLALYTYNGAEICTNCKLDAEALDKIDEDKIKSQN